MPDAADARSVWFRSLYWRIALGSIAVLAVLLLVQALVFLWMSGTIATTLLGQSPDRIAAEAAKEVAAALQKDPAHRHREVRPRPLRQPDAAAHGRPGRRPGRRGTTNCRRRTACAGGRAGARRAPGRGGPGGPPPEGLPPGRAGPDGARGAHGRSARGWEAAVTARRASAPPIEVGGARSGSCSSPAATRGPRCSCSRVRARRRPSSASSC